MIGLARIDRLDLLSLLPIPVYVTEVVWSEATGDPEKPGVVALRQALNSGLIQIVAEGDPAAFPDLDPGESAVLSAAAAAHGAVLLDERRARALIDSYPGLRQAIVEVTGIIGLTLLAKRRGYIPAVRPLLDALRAESFHIAPGLYEAVLRQAGE